MDSLTDHEVLLFSALQSFWECCAEGVILFRQYGIAARAALGINGITGSPTLLCRAQQVDLFGEIAGMSFSPDSGRFFVGIADITYPTFVVLNRGLYSQQWSGSMAGLRPDGLRPPTSLPQPYPYQSSITV